MPDKEDSSMLEHTGTDRSTNSEELYFFTTEAAM
jgi:hypothetical protein